MVNIFITHPSIEETARTIDPYRRHKQSTEAKQIITIIIKNSQGIKSGHYHHPAALMWTPYLEALKYYYNYVLYYAINIDKVKSQGVYYEIDMNKIELPWFLNYWPMIYTHRAHLYIKYPEYYRDKFTIPHLFYLKIGYIWTNKHPYEVYYNSLLGTEEEVNNKIISLAAPMDKRYLNPQYCSAINKAQNKPCGRILKHGHQYCGTHKPKNAVY